MAVILTAQVNPNALPTTAFFIWGPTNYGFQTTPRLLEPGETSVGLMDELNCADPYAVYHYRAVAFNASGTNYGADRVMKRFVGALNFDGTNDHVSVPGGGGLAGLAQATIELWVRWRGPQNAVSGYGYGHVLGRWCSGIGNNILGLSASDPGQAAVAWWPYNIAPSLTGSNRVGNDVWRHVAVSFRSGDHRLYLDGMLDGAAAITGTLSSDTAPSLTIGASVLSSGKNYARCSISEVRLWNVIRTQTEIQQAMRLRLAGTEPGLIGYWRFDEGEGPVAWNAVLNGSHGLLVNGPAWVESSSGAFPDLELTAAPIFRLPGGGMLLRFVAEPGTAVGLKASSDLTTWIDLETNVAKPYGAVHFLDCDAGTVPQRFYRIIAP